MTDHSDPADAGGQNAGPSQQGAEPPNVAPGGEQAPWGPPMEPPDRPLHQPVPPPPAPPTAPGPRYEEQPQPPMAWPTNPTQPVPGWNGPHPWVDPGTAAPWAASTGQVPAAGPPSGTPSAERPSGVPPMYPPESFATGPAGPGGPVGPGNPPAGAAYPLPGSGGTASRRGARLPIAVAVVLLLLAAAAGFGGGLLANQTHSSSSSEGVQATVKQVTLEGSAAQPAAAVAKALSPAVVQLRTNNDLGSGFIYNASGLILTAAHVVGNVHTIQVKFSDGTTTTGTVVGSDQGTDVAVVRIKPPKKLAVAALGSSNDVEVGETAIAIGSPFGLQQSVTQGIVSATGRPVQTEGGSVPMIQTDAPINPGNSGGALANVHGQVIGINDAIYTNSSSASGGEAGNVGVGFAIPIDLAKTIADRLVAGKSVGTGYLGIEGGDSTGSTPGAVVSEVEPNTPAANAKLQTGDLITAVNGTRITSMGSLAAAIATHQPGSTVTLTVVRDGKKHQVKVTLGNRAEALQDESQDQFPSLTPGG